MSRRSAAGSWSSPRIYLASLVVLAWHVLSASSLPSQEDARAKPRFEIMQSAVGSLEPESSELKPKPALTAAARLTQMRQWARRFAATERVNDGSIECRLLSQPIDRYQSATEKIVDGAIFAYANGTNPELAVVFESDGERWWYGTLR